MASERPLRRIGDLMIARREKLVLQPGVQYRAMGVRWHGKGAYVRAVGTTETIKAKSMWVVREGDFVFNRIDTQNGPFDIVSAELEGALVTNEFPTYVAGPEIDTRYLLLHFQQPSVLAQIDALRAGSEGRARWKEADFEASTIYLPPLEEQQRIVEVVHSIRDYRRSLEEELTSVAAMQTCLAADLLAGRVSLTT